METPNDYGRNDDKVEGGGGVDRPPVPGHIAHTNILDPSVAGRTTHPLSANMLHDIS